MACICIAVKFYFLVFITFCNTFIWNEKGKCYSKYCWSQAHNQTTGVLGAVKVIEVRSEEQLDDYIIEIDILASCRHTNILSLLDAIFFEGWLWVGNIIYMDYEDIHNPTPQKMS